MGGSRRRGQLFFINHSGKLILDEVQYAPEFFSEIKRIVDQQDDMGQYILTGSQAYSLMENMSESLAGRLGILELKPLSTREILSQDQSGKFKPSAELIKRSPNETTCDELWKIIHRVSMPELYRDWRWIGKTSMPLM